MPKRVDLSKAKTRAATTDSAEHLFNSQIESQTFVELERIQDRLTGDTRPINETHLDGLISSISALGLITPLTVDRDFRLLAGGHRKEALTRLKVLNPERFEELFDLGIPVRIMNIDSATDIVDALQIEVEENTQRKNYTTQEIKDAAKKLEESGYKRLKGRPSKDQKSLNRELMSVFRLSRRRITEILNDDASSESAHQCALSEDAQRFLKQVIKFQGQLPDAESSTVTKIERDLNRVIKNLYKLIDEQSDLEK